MAHLFTRQSRTIRSKEALPNVQKGFNFFDLIVFEFFEIQIIQNDEKSNKKSSIVLIDFVPAIYFEFKSVTLNRLV